MIKNKHCRVCYSLFYQGCFILRVLCKNNKLKFITQYALRITGNYSINSWSDSSALVLLII
jgi:hypothetical protein